MKVQVMYVLHWLLLELLCIVSFELQAMSFLVKLCTILSVALRCM